MMHAFLPQSNREMLRKSWSQERDFTLKADYKVKQKGVSRLNEMIYVRLSVNPPKVCDDN